MNLTPYRKDYHTAANQGCLLSAIYAYGDMPPNYPVPAVELDNALSMPYERVMPFIKLMILRRKS